MCWIEPEVAVTMTMWFCGCACWLLLPPPASALKGEQPEEKTSLVSIASENLQPSDFVVFASEIRERRDPEVHTFVTGFAREGVWCRFSEFSSRRLTRHRAY